MRLPFRQGILKRANNCLQGIGSNVSIQTINGPIVVTLSNHGAEYYHTEPQVSNSYVAWTNLVPGTQYWLFFDINKSTGIRTFGQTTLAPTNGNIPPANPGIDQHWFDTNTMTTKVWSGNVWVEYIRVFIASTNATNQFTYYNFGTQVGVSTPYESGQILFDGFGKVLRQSDGTFLTSNDQFFVNGSSIHAASLESTIISAIATEIIPDFSVVTYTSFGNVSLARYEDIGTSVIAFVTNGVMLGGTTNILLQGVITNPNWNWTNVNTPLWVDNNGQLVSIDPHTTNSLRPKAVPIARVISPDTIIFEQGLGGLGEQGIPGNSSASNALSTNVSYGIVRLATVPTLNSDPLVVGDNDTRLTNARTPTAHTHPATDITYIGHTGLPSSSVQTAIDTIDANKLNISGGTLTGPLTLSSDPTTTLQAATKQYVDGMIGSLGSVSLVQPNNQVLYGTGSSVSSSQDFSVDLTNGLFSFQPLNTISPADVTLTAASVDDTDPLTNQSGGNVYISSGTGAGQYAGGRIVILGGNGGGSSANDVGDLPVNSGYYNQGGTIELLAGAGGTFGGDGGDLSLSSGPGTGNARGGTISILGGNGGDSPVNGVGTGDSSVDGVDSQGGAIEIVAGSGGSSGDGGQITITSGQGGDSGDGGGKISIRGGGGGNTLVSGDGDGGDSPVNDADSQGGAIEIVAGAGGALGGSGGDLHLSSGNGTGSSTGGTISIIGGNGGDSPVNDVDSQGGAIEIAAGNGGPSGGYGGDLNLSSGNGGVYSPVNAYSVTPVTPIANRPIHGGTINIIAGGGTDIGYGGPINITSGLGGSSGDGGAITIKANSGGAIDGSGGILTLQAGDLLSGSNLSAGNVVIQAGDDQTISGVGNGGSILLHAGISPTGTPGDIVFRVGNDPGSYYLWETFRIDHFGTWYLAGQPGDPQQVLTSTGSGSPPVWNTVDLSQQVNKNGDVMLGPLSMNADPVDPLGAATKQYVDNHVYNVPYDIHFSILGNMTTGDTIVGSFIASRNIFVNVITTPLLGTCRTAPVSDVTYTLKLNGNSIGTLNFNAGAVTMTYTISTTFTMNRGDLLELYTPSVVESNIKDVTIVITGCAPATPCSMV